MLEIQAERERGSTGACGGDFEGAGREARNKARHAVAIVVEAGKCCAKKALFRCDDGDIDEGEANGEHESNEPAHECEGESSSDEHGAEIQRIASERVRAAGGELAIFFDGAG